MNDNLLKINISCDLCVIGGGLAGSFAALSAARHGAKVVLIQDRPMLGGNASSEIRVWVRGAKGMFDRESGLIAQLEERNIKANPTLVPSLFDATLFEMLSEQENLQILLNTSCVDATVEGGKITSVVSWQTTTYKWYTVHAKYFADCSGDSILSAVTGAKFKTGRESKDEFHETLALDSPDSCTMGMSVLLSAREVDYPVKFTAPNFANKYPDDICFESGFKSDKFVQNRAHNIETSGGNLWWVELGGNCDAAKEADTINYKLQQAVYGVWDHIKNQGDHGKDNWDLDWVGCLPGKRESRRYVGDITVTELDLVSGGNFDDEIAFGGWPLDDHNPYGLEQNDFDSSPSKMIPLDKPYGLPYRAIYSQNIENLFFAGRNISVTHVALSSTRVMATCALLGQAAGTAAAIAVKYSCSPRDIYNNHIKLLQKTLQDDGMFLPHTPRNISPIMANAALNITKAEKDILLNGIERPRNYLGENSIKQQIGGSLVICLEKPCTIGTLRLQFDPDYERKSISDNMKMRVFAMKLHTGKDFKPVRVAKTIVKEFKVYVNGNEAAHIKDNFLSLLKIPLNVRASQIKIQWIATNGACDINLFSVDFI